MHKNAQKCRHVTGSLCLFRVAGGTRVLHPRALLHHVHVCQRVGHTWPKYPAALLPSVEVQSHNTCPSSCVWAFGFTKETSRLFLGFSTGLLMVQRWCTILWAWWTLTFSTTARRSPGASWAFIWSLSSIISTGELELFRPNFMAEVSRIVFDIVWTYFHVVVWSTPWWASNKHVFWGYERRTGMNSSSLHLYWLSPFCFLFNLILDKISGAIWMNVHRFYHFTTPCSCRTGWKTFGSFVKKQKTRTLTLAMPLTHHTVEHFFWRAGFYHTLLAQLTVNFQFRGLNGNNSCLYSKRIKSRVWVWSCTHEPPRSDRVRGVSL